MKLNLVVIKSKNIAALIDFYSVLGCHFQKHKHGKGSEHYAYEHNGVVFEIYPQENEVGSTTGTRIGFQVDSIEEVVNRLHSLQRGCILSDIKNSPWGRRVIIDDPEGHRVELTE